MVHNEVKIKIYLDNRIKIFNYVIAKEFSKEIKRKFCNIFEIANSNKEFSTSRLSE